MLLWDLRFWKKNWIALYSSSKFVPNDKKSGVFHKNLSALIVISYLNLCLPS